MKNRIQASWQHGCFENMDDLPVHTIPSHHTTKMDGLPKTFVQIILAAKWLGRHSSTSHKQQRRPMPSLLSLSFFYGAEVRTSAWGAKSNHVLFSLLHVIVECSVPNNKWHWLGLKKICSPCSPCRIRPIFSGSGFDLQMTYLPMNYSSKLGNSSRPPTLFETSNIVAYTPTITT